MPVPNSAAEVAQAAEHYIAPLKVDPGNILDLTIMTTSEAAWIVAHGNVIYESQHI